MEEVGKDREVQARGVSPWKNASGYSALQGIFMGIQDNIRGYL